jgi:hypothetical protein
VGSRHSSSQSINFVVNLVKLENIANLSSGSFKKAISDRSKHISSSFDTALYGLENDVLMMSSLPDRIFQTAIEALFNRDSELCDHVIAEDEEIDILEKQVEGIVRGWAEPHYLTSFGLMPAGAVFADGGFAQV